jgi:sterol desaturase/sphingolipid hydroxylase (fatty acid hydroxylase superfamily)
MDRVVYIAAATILLSGLLFGLERLVPLRRQTRSLWARVFVNLGISAVTFFAASMLVKPAAMAALHWASNRPFGLLHVWSLPAPLTAALGFLLMDLSFYYWHVANHRISLLWRFHNVHHIDPDLDVTTAFRFHFGEVAMSAGFRVMQIILTGVSLGVYAVYELVFQANTAFHHSNVRLPIRLERLLNKLLVTPRMHGLHHSQIQAENNSNYGVVFPWWDRLHRTLGLNIAQSEVVIGVAGYSRPEDNQIWNVLRLPFCKQRDYWRRPDGTILERDPASRHGHHARLAE